MGMWNLSMSSDGKDLRRKILCGKVFSNIKFTTEEISSLMKALKDARMDEEDLVRKWRDEHRELVESWIPES